MALIAAVSDLSIFFDMVKGITIANDKINSRSEGEKSPSGPMRIVKFLLSLKFSIYLLNSSRQIIVWLNYLNFLKNLLV